VSFFGTKTPLDENHKRAVRQGAIYRAALRDILAQVSRDPDCAPTQRKLDMIQTLAVDALAEAEEVSGL
jgi:hypothetical protein